jgi:hypothetical protein
MRHVRILFTTFAVVAAAALSACDKSTAPVLPGTAEPHAATRQSAMAGTLVAEPPSVLVLSSAGRPVRGARVTFEVRSGGGVLTGSAARTGADGIASVGSWTLGSEPGFNAVHAVVEGLSTTQLVFAAVGLPPACNRLVGLDIDVGAFHRFSASADGIPCLEFDPGAGADRQYLLLFENMPMFGASSRALFPASSANPSSDTVLAYTLRSIPERAPATPAVVMQRVQAAPPPRVDAHSWDFGAGRIYEHRPPEPAVPPAAPLIRSAAGALVAVNSAAADPQVGDTIHGLRMEGIARLGIGLRFDVKAVIRHVSPELIMAEDTRLATTLTRENGRHNTPLSQAVLDSIALEYAAIAHRQGDVLFDGRHNAAVEAGALPRAVAVHSLMYADNIWGYTYSSTNYFVFDYWVATDGSTRGINQHPHRLADNLFMHEIAHMRHWGVVERNGYPPRGNLWLVEGFARFSERLPIAARLLDSPMPSRTANVVLPLNPAFNFAYFRDDVPSFLNAGTPFVSGYEHSGYVFDYFVDRVALNGGDWHAALRELLVGGGRLDAFNAALDRWLPGMTLPELITRARIALYTDDMPGLPEWTQYHQYQLRLSRPRRSQELLQDPRDAWPLLAAGSALEMNGTVPVGGATGFIIAGSSSAGRSLYSIEAPARSNVVITITRLR